MPNKRVVGQGGEKSAWGNRTVISEVYPKLGESAADRYPDVTASSREGVIVARVHLWK